MAKAYLNLFLNFFIIMFLLNVDICAQAKQWCTVQDNAPPAKLQGFLDYACSKVINCAPINPGGACFEKNTLLCHASWALNTVYRATNACNLDIGLLQTQDPSYRNCVYA